MICVEVTMFEAMTFFKLFIFGGEGEGKLTIQIIYIQDCLEVNTSYTIQN